MKDKRVMWLICGIVISVILIVAAIINSSTISEENKDNTIKVYNNETGEITEYSIKLPATEEVNTIAINDVIIGNIIEDTELDKYRLENNQAYHYIKNNVKFNVDDNNKIVNLAFYTLVSKDGNSIELDDIYITFNGRQSNNKEEILGWFKNNTFENSTVHVDIEQNDEYINIFAYDINYEPKINEEEHEHDEDID